MKTVVDLGEVSKLKSPWQVERLLTKVGYTTGPMGNGQTVTFEAIWMTEGAVVEGTLTARLVSEFGYRTTLTLTDAAGAVIAEVRDDMMW